MLFVKTFGISLVFNTIGFIKYVYFVSLGYGISIAVIGAYLLLTHNLKGIEIFIGIMHILYGLRLSLFLVIREFMIDTYNKKMKNEIKSWKEVNIKFKIFIWVSCCLLYACQSSPLTFRILSSKEDGILSYIGIIISFLGFLLELKADSEKNAAKKINPKRFVDSGLYKIVRCPNYFGELMFWIGNFIGGIKIYDGFFQWFISLLGLILIIYVMFSGARRIEMRQNKSYGKDPEYRKYIKTTPILIPIVPIYSVEKYAWLKA